MLPAAFAQQPAAANCDSEDDYSDGANWLCRPQRKAGEQDACAVDLTATVVAADGATRVETWQKNEKPTSTASTFTDGFGGCHAQFRHGAGRKELNVVKQQFARFGSQCRLFAPLYRQITLRHCSP